MFKFEDLKMMQIELTSKCQASCPMCMRNVYGGLKNPYLKLTGWTIDEFKRVLDEEVIGKLIYMLICGQYGEPLVNPDYLKIIEYIKSVNPEMFVTTHTNGSVHNEDWWRNLAHALPKKHQMTIGIDGVDQETHSIYRIGTDYDKIIRNMTAFINEGGLVTWEFIRFKHNEHQVDAARDLATKLGVRSFAVKDTSRFIDGKPFPVKDKNGEILYYLEPGTNTQAAFITQDIVDNYKQIVENTQVECYALGATRIFLDAAGRVFPCTPHGSTMNVSPDYGDITDPLRHEAYRETNEIFKNIDNDTSRRSIREIIDSPEWQEEWSQYANNKKKCITCARNCGIFDYNKLTRFSDENIEKSPFYF